MGCPYTDQCDNSEGQCVYFYTYCKQYKNFARRENADVENGMTAVQRNFDSYAGKYL